MFTNWTLKFPPMFGFPRQSRDSCTTRLFLLAHAQTKVPLCSSGCKIVYSHHFTVCTCKASVYGRALWVMSDMQITIDFLFSCLVAVTTRWPEPSDTLTKARMSKWRYIYGISVPNLCKQTLKFAQSLAKIVIF